MRAMADHRPFPLILLLSFACVACDEQRSPAPEEKTASSSPSEASPRPAPEPKQAAEAKPDAATQAQAELLQGAACLPGKWHYDFADDSLETMIENAPGARVTREEGELVCEISLDGKKGVLTCAVPGGQPLVIEITSDQVGVPLEVSMQVSGKTRRQFELVDEQSMALGSDDLQGLEVEVTMSVAGRKIPFPLTDQLLAWTGGESTIRNRFECKGKELRLLPQVDAKASWQTLTRIE